MSEYVKSSQDAWEPVEFLPEPQHDYRLPAAYALVDYLNGQLDAVSRQHETVVAEADFDKLTGLLNQNAFLRDFPEIVLDMKRQEKPLVMAWFDLDGLKRLNDYESYEEGDRFIQLVAEKIGVITRKGDQLYRYGGDEIAVVMPNFAAESELGFHEIIARIESIHNKWDGNLNNSIKSAKFPSDLHLGVSLGIGLLSVNETADDFLNRVRSYEKKHKQDRKQRLKDQGIMFGDSRLIIDSLD